MPSCPLSVTSILAVFMKSRRRAETR
jgi:hypothetical protein